MLFLDRGANPRRYFAYKEVDAIRMPMHSPTDCTLQFSYMRGKVPREIMLRLSREEAIALKKNLAKFITDKDW